MKSMFCVLLLKRFALLLSLLLMSSTAFAGGPIFNWTIYNPTKDFPTYGDASNSAVEGTAATWAPSTSITVRRVEYQSSQVVNCGVFRPVIVFASTAAYHALYVNTEQPPVGATVDYNPLYTDSGAVAWKFAAGTKLLVESAFVLTWSQAGLSGSCNTPPGNIVVTYSIP